MTRVTVSPPLGSPSPTTSDCKSTFLAMLARHSAYAPFDCSLSSTCSYAHTYCTCCEFPLRSCRQPAPAHLPSQLLTPPQNRRCRQERIFHEPRKHRLRCQTSHRP